MKQIGVKEAVNRALFSMKGLENIAEDLVENQVVRLVEAIQQLQKRVE
jgi:hypothetical protein